MFRHIMTLIGILCFVGVALVVLGMKFFVPEQEFRTENVWIPRGGVEDKPHAVDAALGRRSDFALDEIPEISLDEFRSRNYDAVIYGAWGDDTAYYVFYWARTADPVAYPNGIWARQHFPPPWGMVGAEIPNELLDEKGWYFGDHPAWPMALFDGDTVTVSFEKSWSSSRTFLPDAAPTELIFRFILVGALCIVIGQKIQKQTSF